jgi:hypothetical protein
MKTPAAFVIALLLALLAGGCTAVRSPQPFGDKPHALVAAEWEGTWVGLEEDDHEEPVRFMIADAADGRLQVTWIKEKDGMPVLETHQVVLREGGDWMFISVLADEDHKEKGFVWGRLRREGELMIIWKPDVPKFEKLIEDGKLKGKTDDGDVVLEPLTAKNLTALTSGELGVPFNWDNPMVLHRIGKANHSPEAAADKPTSSVLLAPNKPASHSAQNPASASPPVR